jgi:hypothetical protein
MNRSLVVVFAVMLMHAASAQPVPQLRYDAPPNFYRSASAPLEDYSASDVNAGVQVYPFRPFNGSIEQAFHRTLLREWIDPRFQEANVAATPDFRPTTVAGAQLAITVRFVENVAGMAKQRQRMLVVVGNAGAIVDAAASSMTAWQQVLPRLNAMSATMRVEAGAAPPRDQVVAASDGQAIAGLYAGTKSNYVPDLIRGVGYGSHVMMPHFYLFSADGRVYRAYNGIRAPSGIERFDYDAAQRADAGNSGRYAVQRNQLQIRMGDGQGSDAIVTARPQGGRLTINSVQYVRQ